MEIRCKVCNRSFKSLLIDPVKACSEVSTALAEHMIQTKNAPHIELYQQTGLANGELMAALPWLLLMKTAAEISEDEHFILGEQERLLAVVAEWITPEDGDDEVDEDEADPEGLRALLLLMLATHNMLEDGKPMDENKAIDGIIEYVFGPAELEPKPEPQEEQEQAPEPASKPRL